VTIVDEQMARQLWPDGNAVGQRIKRELTDNPRAPWITVIGVVGRVKQYTLDADSRMAMHLPHAQAPARAMNVVVRSASDPAALTAAVRREIRAMDPDLPIYGARSMTARVDESLATRRFSMLLLTLFAALALGIASIGIYGVMAYLVNQGARELGIRLALGATPALILRMVVSQGMTVALVGVVSGIVGAFALTHVMKTMLFGINAVDVPTFVAIPVLLSGIALLASWIPARRAARIDPTISLRSE
jgi:ABC-type lipoprotein release transport system permease subunit